MVATERSMVAYDDIRVVSSAVRPCREPKNPTAAGTYADPAHKPLIETNKYRAFKIVRRRNFGENSIAIARLADSGGFHLAGSFTPYWISTTRNAGNPPTANIALQ